MACRVCISRRRCFIVFPIIFVIVLVRISEIIRSVSMPGSCRLPLIAHIWQMILRVRSLVHMSTFLRRSWRLPGWHHTTMITDFLHLMERTWSRWTNRQVIKRTCMLSRGLCTSTGMMLEWTQTLTVSSKRDASTFAFRTDPWFIFRTNLRWNRGRRSFSQIWLRRCGSAHILNAI